MQGDGLEGPVALELLMLELLMLKWVGEHAAPCYPMINQIICGSNAAVCRTRTSEPTLGCRC